MPFLALLALRQLVGYRRRAALVGLTIVFGVAASALGHGFVLGLLTALSRFTIDTNLSAMQISRDSASEQLRDLGFPLDPLLVRDLLALDGVRAVSPRLTVLGTASNGEIFAPALIVGIDPGREAKVCPALAGQHSGDPLDDADRGVVVLGAELAQAITHHGPQLTLQLQTKAGQPNATVMRKKSELSLNTMWLGKRLVMMPLMELQALVRAPEIITTIAIAVTDLSRVEAIALDVRRVVGAGFVVKTWPTLNPNAARFMSLLKTVLRAVDVALLVVMAMLVSNTLALSVHERRHQFAAMLSVGLKRRALMALVLLEAALLGLVAGCAGLLLGGGATAWLGHVGVRVHVPPAAPYDVFPELDAAALVTAMVLALLSAMAASAAPARRLLALNPAQALRS